MNKEELLDAWFEGKLTPEQEKQLKELMDTDEVFREEFGFRRELREALRREEHESLRKMMRDTAAEKPTAVRSIRRFIPALVAAMVIILVTIGYFIVTSPGPRPAQLYTAYFEPYENVVHPIERGAPVQDLASRAFLAYENGDYEEAISLFEQLAGESPDPYIVFYSGIVLLQLDRDEEAIAHFLTYLDSSGSLKDRAEWYLALGYLKEGNIPRARELLSGIAGRAAYKAEESREILESLD